MSETYQLVMFDNDNYGVRAWDNGSWKYVEPLYKKKLFRKKYLIGAKPHKWSAEFLVARYCFMSKADAEELFRIVNQEEDMETILYGKIKNPTVVSAYSG